MLRDRILTALALLPVVLSILFVVPENFFAISIGLILLAGAWEWMRLVGFESCLLIWIFMTIFSQMLVGAYFLPTFYAMGLVGVGCLFWVGALFIVVTYPRHRNQFAGAKIKLIFGVAVLIPAYIALLHLRRHEAHLLFISLLVATTCTADVAAYFIGRQFGTTKLAPNVSPGKSWAGMFGGISVALSIGIVSVLVVKPMHYLFSLMEWAVLVGIIMLTVLSSVLGDLFESLIKREQGVKDSSSLLPGHGGVMDRIDSLTAAAPIFTFTIYITGWPWL